MNLRSTAPNVRNPLVELPSFKALQALNPELRCLVRALFLDLRREARVKASVCLTSRKYMMFAYWQVVAVYSGHAANKLR